MAEVDIKLPYKMPTFHDWQPHATFYHPLYAGSIDGTDLYPHDRAVVRAVLSTYNPNKNVTGDQSKTLFVARLSKDTTQDAIQDIFEKFGELEKCRLIRDFVSGFSRGYAFVEFKRKKDALNAARETHRMNVDGRQILVDFECERNLDGWKPRRFGGGFGGRKESGQLRFGGIDRPFRRPLPENVDHFNRGVPRENSVTFQDSRGDQSKINRDRERYGTRERDHDEYDRDRRSHARGRERDDRRDYKSSDRNHRGEKRDREEHYRSKRGRSKDRDDDYRDSKRRSRDHKDRDKDKREYKERDYSRHDRKDRDDRDRRGRRSRDRERNRDSRDDIKSESSNSSRDPD